MNIVTFISVNKHCKQWFSPTNISNLVSLETLNDIIALQVKIYKGFALKNEEHCLVIFTVFPTSSSRFEN